MAPTTHDPTIPHDPTTHSGPQGAAPLSPSPSPPRVGRGERERQLLCKFAPVSTGLLSSACRPLGRATLQRPSDMAGERRLTKNQKKRLRKKKERAKRAAVAEGNHAVQSARLHASVDVEYVERDIEEEFSSVRGALGDREDLKDEFRAIFGKFASAGELLGRGKDGDAGASRDDGTGYPQGADTDARPQAAVSTKAARKASRMSVAELKQRVLRPEVVELHDVTAPDPLLLAHLKAMRKTVPVPRHWSSKRKYLQGKRAIERAQWTLPEFLRKTGIVELREASERDQTAKQKARSRTAPKMGRLDMNYEVMHDAFFKWQTRPKLSRLGDLYYEGKEFETEHSDRFHPGILSAALREALGISQEAPPPWLVNMQRYGPPPAYPNLRIAGLNAPIPKGASFGHHPGGWGQPPVDETGMPIYGADVFRAAEEGRESNLLGARKVWGDLSDEEPSDDEVSEESDAEEGVDVASDASSGTKGAGGSGEGDSLRSAPAALGPSATAETMPMPGQDMGANAGRPKRLFEELKQEKNEVGNDLFGGDKKYAMPGAHPESDPPGRRVETESTDGAPDGDRAKRRRFDDQERSKKRLKNFRF